VELVAVEARKATVSGGRGTHANRCALGRPGRQPADYWKSYFLQPVSKQWSRLLRCNGKKGRTALHQQLDRYPLSDISASINWIAGAWAGILPLHKVDLVWSRRLGWCRWPP